jgi:hypothetical protein
MYKLLANLLGMLFSREDEEIEEKFIHCSLCDYVGTKIEIELHLKKRHNL